MNDLNIALKHPQALYIGGAWVKPASGNFEEVINPATEEVIGLAPVGSKADVDAALLCAREAFDKGPWPRMKPAERAKKLQAFHAALVRRVPEIAALNTAEAGSTSMVALHMHVLLALKHLQYFIDISVRDPATSLPIELVPNMAGTTTLGAGVMVREPYGVVVCITAYNFPFLINLGKVAPALAAGNCIVLKPSPYTPFEALILGEAAEEAGLPKGVLNIITGGKEVGEILTTDKRVDMISFTGSDLVGAAIMAQAAPTLKKVHLELGGKSAMIVRADANLADAAAMGLMNITLQCGQGCVLMTRHLVHNAVRKQYVELIGEMARKIRVGNPADPQTEMGPLIRDVQRQRVERFVDLGHQAGGKLIAGGQRPAHLKKGYFYEPTLFDGIHNSSEIAQNEIFGPVGVIIGFDSDEEAIAIANDSAFGLGGGIYSADVGKAYEMALQMRTGGVLINGGTGTISSAAPFGGYKRSGIGREFGVEGLNEFTQIKSIMFHGG